MTGRVIYLFFKVVVYSLRCDVTDDVIRQIAEKTIEVMYKARYFSQFRDTKEETGTALDGF